MLDSPDKMECNYSRSVVKNNEVTVSYWVFILVQTEPSLHGVFAISSDPENECLLYSLSNKLYTAEPHRCDSADINLAGNRTSYISLYNHMISMKL